MAAKEKHKAASPRPRKNINPGQGAAYPSPPEGRARPMAAPLQGPGIYTVKLSSIPGLRVSLNQGEDMQVVECISDQLYECYLQYCKINKHKPVELRTGEEAERIRSIFSAMETLVKKVSSKINLNIDKNAEGNYYFTAYYFLINSDTLWAFPLEFLKQLSEEYPSLGEVAIPFFSKALYQIGFSDFNNNGHLEYLIAEYDNQMDMFGDEMDIEARMLSAEQMKNYLPGGDAQDYLNRLRHPKRMNIRDRLNRLRPKQDKFKFLKNWMLEGLKLYESPDWININSFDYVHETDNGYSDNDYSDRVEADRIYTIAWTIDDFIWDQYKEGINMDIGDFGVVEPIGFHLINQKQNKPLQMNTWFNEWITWFDRGMVAICKYLEDKKKNERHNQGIIIPV